MDKEKGKGKILEPQTSAWGGWSSTALEGNPSKGMKTLISNPLLKYISCSQNSNMVRHDFIRIGSQPVYIEEGTSLYRRKRL